jgi:hypothetical protein
MTHYGTWIGYSGDARMVLAIVLLAAAGAVAYAGIRLPHPLRPPKTSEAAKAFLIGAWAFAIVAFLACVVFYVQQARREHLLHAAPADPITPITFIGVGVIFFVLLVSSSRGWRVTLASAAIGALAAPMVFEFPFDLIVMARTYPAITPDPALYRVLFFAPLFLVEFTTLALLALSPMVRLSKAALFFFALMLAVFAVWGLAGFDYPSSPVPFTLNVVSKILAFAVTLSLFLPQRDQDSTPDPQRGDLASAGRPAALDRVS